MAKKKVVEKSFRELITELTEVKKGKKDDDDDFKTKLVRKINSDPDLWDTLTEDIQEWFNDAVAERNADNPYPAFPDEDDGDEEDETPKKSKKSKKAVVEDDEGEDEDEEPVKTKKTGKKTKKAVVEDDGEDEEEEEEIEEEEEEEVRTATQVDILTHVANHPKDTAKKVIKALEKAGLAVRPTSVDSLVAMAHKVISTLEANGWVKQAVEEEEELDEPEEEVETPKKKKRSKK